VARLGVRPQSQLALYPWQACDSVAAQPYETIGAMDVFLIGFRSSAPTYTQDGFASRLAAPGHGAALIRDWTSLTDDDTRWGVVVDAPEALSVREAADELGLEIRGTIRLLPDPAVPQPGSDWAARMLAVLPAHPPPQLHAVIAPGGDETNIYMAMPPDLPACGVCGWIGDHDPAVPHPSPG
jgi:hypothetical protein